MSRISAFMNKHPLASFFALAYVLSWWVWILYAVGISPIPIASFGPFLAAVVVLAVTEGRRGLVGLFRRMGRWRVKPGWYAVALLLPGVLALAATVLNVLFGAERPSATELNAWPGLFMTFAFVLLVPGVGGAWEEPGWRGFAVPRLQVGQSALVASLILGVLIAGWHIPLMIAGQVAYSDIVLILAAVIVFNWVFNNAAGSVLIIMLMHAANNTISGSYFSSMFAGADSIRQSWLLAAVWAVAAVLVIVFSGPEHFSHKHRRQEEPSYQVPPVSPEASAQTEAQQ